MEPSSTQQILPTNFLLWRPSWTSRKPATGPLSPKTRWLTSSQQFQLVLPGHLSLSEFSVVPELRVLEPRAWRDPTILIACNPSLPPPPSLALHALALVSALTALTLKEGHCVYRVLSARALIPRLGHPPPLVRCSRSSLPRKLKMGRWLLIHLEWQGPLLLLPALLGLRTAKVASKIPQSSLRGMNASFLGSAPPRLASPEVRQSRMARS